MEDPAAVELLPSSDGEPSGVVGDLGDELAQVATRYAGNAIRLAAAHPEIVLLIGAGLLAHKKSPGFRSFVSRLVGNAGPVSSPAQPVRNVGRR